MDFLYSHSIHKKHIIKKNIFYINVIISSNNEKEKKRKKKRNKYFYILFKANEILSVNQTKKDMKK